MASDDRVFDVLYLPGMLFPHVSEVVETAAGRSERRPLTEPLCDFCLEPLPKVPCEDFIYPGENEGSRGSWGACDTCADLIRSGDREALSERSLIPYGDLPASDLAVARAEVTKAQEQFWLHKTGDPEPWKDDES